MASMCRLAGLVSRTNVAKPTRILRLQVCRECIINRSQVRFMSDGRKSFLTQWVDNMKQEFSKNKEMKESLKKFREERKKLEESDAIQKARQKFDNIESETSGAFKKGFEDVKDKVSETLEEVQKTEIAKKGMKLTEEVGKTAGKAAETIVEQGKNISKTAPFKTISYGVKVAKEEFEETALSRARTYKPPEKLRMRSEKTETTTKIFEADTEAMDVVLHKDSKWFQSWQNFKDNNQYVNKVFDLKTKYDESDNVVVRASRLLTDKVSYLFGNMFSKTEMSEVLTEICKVDPNFDKEKFILWCEFEVIPNLLEAWNRGEEEVLQDWCYEAAFSTWAQPLKQAKAAGLKFDNRILDISNVDLAAGKMMEQGPVLVIMFNAQQIRVVRNKKGDVVEGDPEKIMRMTYVWALCRDQEELNPSAAWRLLDLSESGTEQWL